MDADVCLPLFWVSLATYPLLPQLLFQRCQAAFLPQHAAVPPAERKIHINQLCVTAPAADSAGVNCQAEIKWAEVGLREQHKDKVRHDSWKNIRVGTVHRGGKK